MCKTHLQYIKVILNAPQRKKKRIDPHFYFLFLIKLYMQILRIYLTKSLIRLITGTNLLTFYEIICLTVLPFGRAQQITNDEIRNITFTPVLDKSYVHCHFSKLFIDYLKNANEFELFVFCCRYLVFTSVDLLPFKIKIFDRLSCIYVML